MAGKRTRAGRWALRGTRVCLVASSLLTLSACRAVRPPGSARELDERRLLEAAQDHYLNGRYEEALRPLAEVLSARGKSGRRAEAAFWAGFCRLKLQRPAEAERDFEKALSGLKEPEWVGPGLVGLGDSLFGQGAYRKAEQCYQRAVKHYSRYVDRSWVERRLTLSREGQVRGGLVRETAPPQPVPGPGSAESARRPGVPTGSPSAGPYTLQVGAFQDRDAARQVLEVLQRAGQVGYVQYLQRQGQPLYCVRVGRYRTRSEAERTQERLRTLGFESFIVE